MAAVSKMQRPAADARRKNDRRDAEFIARMLATHNIVEVPLPDMAVEAARDLDRALDDATRELRRSRQRLNMFLIRLGHVWDERNADGARKKAWTRAHWRWVSEIRLEGPQRDALEYYVTAARCAESDRRQLERRVVALAGTDRWRATVEALSCIKGVDTLTAFRLAAEAGSFSRFRSAPAFASWCGLVPSERSSGESERRGGITKAGNALARTALIESAWHYSTCSPRPKAPAPGTDVPPAIRSRADDCTARLHRRREALAAAGKSACKANAAVARELACWVWEIGCRSEGT
ncbi:IS110 family transposase, partial [Collinsella aerofaciens]|nr:IS110 family transposase [Collinsella aerofaciens]